MKVCKFQECDRRATRRGLCDAHSNQFYSGKELKPIRPRSAYNKPPNNKKLWTWQDMLNAISQEIAKKSH